MAVGTLIGLLRLPFDDDEGRAVLPAAPTTPV